MKYFIALLFFCSALFAQSGSPETSTGGASPGTATQPQAPAKIEIKPTARDHEIKGRLEGILNATGWFEGTNIQVKEGTLAIMPRIKTALPA